jgi:serralysin
MIADIAALQHMYGANYSVNDGNTRYSWKPDGGETLVNGKVGIDPGGNRIFATIWDGGGRHDSYDLSAYSNNVFIDLAPGGFSKFNGRQVADLGYYEGAGLHKASGNIYNALMYRGNTESLIEDAIGGSGSDKLFGNKVANHLDGNAGDDKFYGAAGNDTFDGGAGADTFYFKAGWDHDKVTNFQGIDKINVAAYQFASVDELLSHAANSGKDVVFSFGSGDSLKIEGMHKGDFHADDFLI